MTLFEVDRVFWTRQDFCLGESWQAFRRAKTEVLTNPEHFIHLERGHLKCTAMLSRCGDSLLTWSPIYCDVIASMRIRESMTSHGHMTYQEKGSGDEDLLTLSPRVRNYLLIMLWNNVWLRCITVSYISLHNYVTTSGYPARLAVLSD